MTSPWHDFRRGGITSTDAVGIMAEDCEREGVEVYSSPLQVWLDKKGLLPEREQSEAMYWGNRLEHLVVEEFSRRTDYLLVPFSEAVVEIVRTHRECLWVPDERGIQRFVIQCGIRGWQRCTPDAFYRRPDGELGILECKTTGFRSAEKWLKVPPVPAQIQAQWHLGTSGLKHGGLACLIGGQRFEAYEFERNHRFGLHLVDRCSTFQREHVNADVEPAPMAQDLDVVRVLAGKDTGHTVVLPAEALEVDAQYRQGDEDAKKFQKYADARKAQIIRWIGGATFGEIPGVCRYSYTTQQRGETEFRQLRRKAL